LTSVRRSVVALLAVLLALAIGVALGAGPLRLETSDAGSTPTHAGSSRTAEARVQQLDDERAFDDAFAAATAKHLVNGTLKNRAVTLVQLPGASPTTVSHVTDLIEQAGGAVTAQVVLHPKLIDVGNRQLVDELATQMEKSAKGAVAVPSDATGYERMGALLAHTVVTKSKRGDSVDDAGANILAGASTAGLVTTPQDIQRRGSLVVAVAGDPYGTQDERTGAGSITATLLEALDQGSGGAVLVGPVTSSADDGLIGQLQADPKAAKRVSTVDMGDQVAGAVVTVLALHEQAQGGSGHYGSSTAPDGPMPTNQ
jgi:hypothetical protein